MKLQTTTLLILSFIHLWTLQVVQAETTSQRTFRVMSVVGTYSDLKYEREPGKVAPIFFNKTLSTPLSLPTSNQLIVFREIPPPANAKPDTPPHREIVMQVTFPNDQDRFILIVSPTESNSLKGFIIKDDSASHPPGHVRVLNLSSYSAAFGLNSTTHALAPSQENTTPYPLKNNYLQIAIAPPNTQSWEIIYQRERICHPGMRLYIFMFNFMDDPLEPTLETPAAIVRVFSERFIPTPKP
jgi:hypothetical protein